MKKTVILFSIIVSSAISFGQWTQGGSEKNYEEFRVIRDTIVKKEKIKIPIKNTSYSYFSVGLVSARDAKFTSLLTPNELVNGFGSPLQPLYSSGEMGGKNGFNMELGGISQIQSINSHLIPYIDLGFAWDINFSTLTYSIDPIATSTQYADWFEDYLADFSPVPFVMGGALFGLSVTVNPIPLDDYFRVDLFVKAGPSIIGGGTPTATYANIFEFDEFGNSIDIDVSSTFEIDNPLTVQFPVQFGFNIRLFDSFFVGARLNTRLNRNLEIREDFSLSQSTGFDSFFFSETYSYTSRTNLKNLTFNIGLTF